MNIALVNTWEIRDDGDFKPYWQSFWSEENFSYRGLTFKYLSNPGKVPSVHDSTDNLKER